MDRASARARRACACCAWLPARAYQLGVQALKGDSRQAPDALAASRHWAQAAEAGHPLAARKLAELYRDGGPGLAPDSERAEHYAQRASALGL